MIWLKKLLKDNTICAMYLLARLIEFNLPNLGLDATMTLIKTTAVALDRCYAQAAVTIHNPFQDKNMLRYADVEAVIGVWYKKIPLDQNNALLSETLRSVLLVSLTCLHFIQHRNTMICVGCCALARNSTYFTS